MYYLLEHAPHDASGYAATPPPEALASTDDGSAAAAKDLVATAATTRTQPLTFILDGPLMVPTDYLETDISGGKLCTARFLEVLRSLSLSALAHPAELYRSLGTARPGVATPYFFWVPPRLDGTIDWERSEIWTDPELGIRQLTKLVVSAACLAAAPPLFRPSERSRSILVHAGACQALEASGVSGVRFFPLDVIADPLFAGQKVVALE